MSHTADDDAFFEDVVSVTEAASYATEGTCSLLDPGWRARLLFKVQCQHGAPEPTPYLLAIALAHGDHSAGVFDYPLLACLGILVLHTANAEEGLSPLRIGPVLATPPSRRKASTHSKTASASASALGYGLGP